MFLGLDDFPIGEPIHVIALIGAIFLRQRAAYLRVGPMRPIGASSGVVPPPPSLQVLIRLRRLVLLLLMVMFSPSNTSDDSNIRRTLDHVLTVQATHGQILVDVLNKIRALRVELAQFRRSSPPPPFDDGF